MHHQEIYIKFIDIEGANVRMKCVVSADHIYGTGQSQPLRISLCKFIQETGSRA
jgi:hypothetical protein